jgi:hypothetical protein
VAQGEGLAFKAQYSKEKKSEKKWSKLALEAFSLCAFYPS